MGGLGGAGNITRDLRHFDFIGHKRERYRWIIPGLDLTGIKIYGFAIQPRRRSGFHPPQGKPGALKGLGQAQGRLVAHPACRYLLVTDMDQATEECSGGQDYPGGGNLPAICENHPSHGLALSSTIEPKVFNRPGDHRQVGVAQDHRLDSATV